MAEDRTARIRIGKALMRLGLRIAFGKREKYRSVVLTVDGREVEE